MRRTSVLQIRVSSEELEQVRESARAANLGISEYVRRELLRPVEIPVEKVCPKCWHLKSKHDGFGVCQVDTCRCGDPANRFTEPPPMPRDPEVAKLLEKVQAEVKVVRGKQCVHGKPKGDNCWQCGGLALIDAEKS